MDALTALEQNIVPGAEELLAITMRDLNERWQHPPPVADFPDAEDDGHGNVHSTRSDARGWLRMQLIDGGHGFIPSS
jgi:hypothetical protein